MDKENAVLNRYSKASLKQERMLCCPVNYNPKYLEVIPEEIIKKDYGCGDPTQYIREEEVVLDLGCGCGKNCYIASQIVGPKGKVIGVDFNNDMLSLAKKYQEEITSKIGWNNVEFHLTKIQDLKSIKNDLINTIISNCVFNLVPYESRKKLFTEMTRILKQGGKAAISDIVSDKEVPSELKNDPDLWSGCIAGAFQENGFIEAFTEAGFSNVEIVKRDEKPWKTINEIKFRSLTVIAYKGKNSSVCKKSSCC